MDHHGIHDVKYSDDYDSAERQTMLAMLDQADQHISRGEWDLARSSWTSLVDNFTRLPSDIICRYAHSLTKAFDFDGAREVLNRQPSSLSDADTRHQHSIVDSAEAKKYILKLSRTNKDNSFVMDDLLGKPFGRIAELGACLIRGWAKVSEGKLGFLVVETPTEQVLLPLNQVRKDVSAHFLRRGQSVNPECGFRHTIDVRRGARLGVLVDGQITYEAEILREDAPEVMEGKDGWLFLANDSNRSRDQFNGTLSLGAENRKSWLEFAKQLSRFQRAHPTAYLIANSKERVVPELYPDQECVESIAMQVAQILEAHDCRCIDPRVALQSESASFFRTDTHWSDLGAYIAYQEVLRRFDYSSAELAGITFEEESAVGDLGSKLFPPVVAKRMRHVYSHEGTVTRVFDNNLSTTGQLRVFTNDRPLYDQTVVLFGGSSLTTGCLYQYFTYQFRRVVLVNLPGSAIKSIVDFEQPSLTVIQTNERYLRVPGKIFSDVQGSPISTSYRRLTESKKKSSLAAIGASEDEFYKRMFLKLV